MVVEAHRETALRSVQIHAIDACHPPQRGIDRRSGRRVANLRRQFEAQIAHLAMADDNAPRQIVGIHGARLKPARLCWPAAAAAGAGLRFGFPGFGHQVVEVLALLHGEILAHADGLGDRQHHFLLVLVQQVTGCDATGDSARQQQEGVAEHGRQQRSTCRVPRGGDHRAFGHRVAHHAHALPHRLRHSVHHLFVHHG
jgi:hypothetical protein